MGVSENNTKEPKVTTTRTLTSYGPETIYIDGLTRGPRGGWRWDGATLSHPLGIRMEMAPDAAARITAAVAAYRPPVSESLSGYELSQRPEAEREGFELVANGWGDDPVDNEHVWRYVRSTDPVPGECEFDTSEVRAVATGRR